ncbi:hypothetical protein Tco_1251171, partial [Tanacetum coccineum]
GVSLNEGGEECGFDSKEDEVVPKVDDVSLVDGIFDGAFGGDKDDDFVIGELVDWMMRLGWKPWKKRKNEENYGEDDEENEGDDYLIKMRWINVVRRSNFPHCLLLPSPQQVLDALSD